MANGCITSTFKSGTTETARVNGFDVINITSVGNTVRNTGSSISVGAGEGGTAYYGDISELVIYAGVDRSGSRHLIERHMNTYYSAYPNPTSVWNLLTAVYSADTTSQSSLKTSLVASYNGESDTNDSFGTNHGTSVGGLTYGAGKIGTAFVGNGTTSYIEVGDKLDLGLSSWSYSIWFYPTNLSFNRTLFSKTAWAAGGGRFALNIESALIAFYITLSDGNYISIRDNSTVLPSNQWSNLTVVVDRNDKVKLYYNGVLSTNVVSLGTINNNLIPYINDNLNNTRPFRIGCASGTDGYNPETPTNFAQGRIDSFNVWNKALTQSEITELYNSGNGAQYIGDNFYKPTTNDALGINNGTAQGGLTYGPGKIGQAFLGNSSNAYVSLPNDSFKPSGSFSINTWINLSQIGTVNAIFTSSASLSSGIRVYVYNDNKLYLDINTNYYGSITTLSANVWYQISITYDGTNYKLYINGNLDKTLTTVAPIWGSNGTNVVNIGRYFGPAGFHFNGKIDAVSTWTRSLTASEITELYNSGNGKQYPF
jgi:hypothetical protein